MNNGRHLQMPVDRVVGW